MKIRDRIKGQIKQPRMELWFIALCLIFGLPLIFLYPPFLASDEIPHFYRAYQVSEFYMTSEARGQEGGGMLPSSLSETVDAVKNNMHKIPGFTLQQLDDVPRLPLAPQDKVWTAFTGAALYSPLPYIPQAIGILIGRLLSLTPLIIHYIARVCSLLTWALMGFLALKIIPFYRNALFILLLTPLVFSKATVVTADVVTVGACTLLTCQVLKMAFGGKTGKTGDGSLSRAGVRQRTVPCLTGVTRGGIVFLFCLAALVGLCKITYAPLAALCFLIPPERFGGKKRFWMICGGTILIAFAVNLLWTGFLAASLPISTGPAASPRAQVMYMLEKPLQFAKIVFNYTFDNLPGNILAMFGSLIVWHEVTLPVWVIVLLWATLLFAALTDKPAAEIKAWRKAGVFVLSACVYVLIIASLYISFSALKSNIVQGMQPRYMFPLLLPLLLILKRKKEWKINITAVYIPISALALAVLDIAMYTRFV